MNGMPLDCAVHSLPCTVHHRGHTGMGQVFTFSHVGLGEYCASQNATPATESSFLHVPVPTHLRYPDKVLCRTCGVDHFEMMFLVEYAV